MTGPIAGWHLLRWASALGGALIVLLAVLPTDGHAAVATPIAPSDGRTFIVNDVSSSSPARIVLRWNVGPADGESQTLEISNRPETSYLGGPFLESSYDALLEPPDRAHLVTLDSAGRYYWHVQSSHCTERDPDLPSFCTDMQSQFGPAATFVVLDGLTARRARVLVQRMVRRRTGSSDDYLDFRYVKCRRQTRLQSRCTFKVLDINAYRMRTGRGRIFYSKDPADNARYYHYDFRVRSLRIFCRYVRKRSLKRCTDRARWRG